MLKWLVFIWWFPILFGRSYQQTHLPHYYSLSWQQFEDLPEVRKIIDLQNPDYELLDAAVFQVSNKVRVKEGKKELQYLPLLHRSASYHAQAMIDLEFYDHYNLRQLSYLTPDKRITAFGGVFHYTSENIAQYDIINTGQEYCPSRLKNGRFRYLNCETHKPYRPYTYIAYAAAVVNGWLHSPSHRKNLLSENYQYLGCAVRISKNPYQQKKVPFGRLVQNFGGYGPDPKATSGIKPDSVKSNTNSSGGNP